METTLSILAFRSAAGRPGRPGPSEGRWDRLLFAVAAAVASLAVIWSAVRLTEQAHGFPAVPAPGDEPGAAHVHGLGVDPADDALHIATHRGTFRLGKDKKPERVGSSDQDTMGFTVVGDGHFLGSGHPDLEAARHGQPSRLGLIDSIDGGATWRPLSLSGEVDFHALVFAHDRVYGWEAGTARFMVSFDRRTWEVRSTQPLAGFAVDPSDSEHIVAAGPEGLLNSTDGGRSWRPGFGPDLVTLSWDPSAGLVGAEANGVVDRSTDGGASWSPTGLLPGSPEALLATPTTWYGAADQGDTIAIYRSTDNGRTWELYNRERS